MATGILGIGTDGVFSADMIDSLKESERNTRIVPYERNLEDIENNIDNTTIILDTFKDIGTQFNELSKEEIYIQKEVSADSNNVFVEINDMSIAEEQSLNIEVLEKANQDMYQGVRISSILDAVSTESGDLSFTINGITKDIYIEADTTTWFDLGTSIESAFGTENISVRFANVSSEGEQRLIVSSVDTGLSKSITIDSSNNQLLKETGFDDELNHIVKASDMRMKINGVEISRSTNEVSDYIEGVNITAQYLGESNAWIDNNVNGITEKLEQIITDYNLLADEAETMQAEASGIPDKMEFVRNIRQMMSDLRNTMFSEHKETGISLVSFGFEFQENGRLKGGDSEFIKGALEDNFADLKKAFTSTEENSEGIFIKIEDKLSKVYNDNNTGYMDQYIVSLETNETSVSERIEVLQTRLDTQYENLTAKYNAYNSMIVEMENSFASLKMQIDQSTTSS